MNLTIIITCNATVDIRLRPGIATPLMAVAARCSLHVLASRPLRPNVMSSIKPEVHNVLQRRQKRTEPQPQGICTKNFVKIRPPVPDICLQTDRRTQKETDAQTHRRRSNYNKRTITIEIESEVVVLDNQSSLDVITKLRFTGRVHQHHLKTFS